MTLWLPVIRAHWMLAACAVILGMSACLCPAAQQAPQQPGSKPSDDNPQAQGSRDQDETRRLWDDEMLQKRPPGRKSSRRRAYKYRRATAPVTPDKMSGPATKSQEIGITLWHLRPSKSADEARLLVQEKGEAEPVEWTPERVEANTMLPEGQRVRLSIESPDSGFLYVIDREKYSDGSVGEPYLIFPTKRTRSGNNAVRAGQVVEIPAQEDTPPYFTLKPGRPRQVAEVLTVLVSPTPLDLPIERNAHPIPKALVKDWEAKWKAPTERIEQVGGRGQAYTKAEKEAGANETRQLTQDEPLPQTIYRVSAKPGDPILVTLLLQYGKTAGP